MSESMKALVVVGARPNFIKAAPLLRELQKRPTVETRLVHTGQHYDAKMSALFFEQLAIPRPDYELNVGSGSHAMQTGEVMKRIEPILISEQPSVVIVVGDVNSTVACAITAVKLGTRVAHVEAGLRSFDRTMPEEINRVITDAISDWLFVTEPSGIQNLAREGISAERVFLVGNVMIDTLLRCRQQAEQTRILEDLEVVPKQYAVLTLHRPASVDDPSVLRGIIGALRELGSAMPIIFPVHPRTRQRLAAWFSAEFCTGLRIIEPLGYLEFMRLVSNARIVLTDSGGVQEETTVLGVRCLTLRTSTERPATIDEGTNSLVGLDPGDIERAVHSELAGPRPIGRVPALWDGAAAKRVVDILSTKCVR